LAIDFFEKLGSADLILISMAEHNGALIRLLSKIFSDWTSRHNNKLFQKTNAFNGYLDHVAD
jgi:hypothetical protein